MILVGEFPSPSERRCAIEEAGRAGEAALAEVLLGEADLGHNARARIAATARRLVEDMRARGAGHGGLDAFLNEYRLGNQEGIVLMCLAEALLRIPDSDTATRLIRDKVAEADWAGHLGHSESLFVNASTWALMLTGRVVRLDEAAVKDVGAFLRRLVAKSGEPVIRQAMIAAMRIMGRQFVLGRSIDEAMARAAEAPTDRYSFDMLGEAALTAADAARYLDAYSGAIAAIGAAAAGKGPVEGPGISVKLSALHPRCEYAARRRVMAELVPRLAGLARQARDQGIGLCVDAEEADRLELSLDVFEAVAVDPALAGWDGLGLAVQAYQKRALAVIDWLAELARRSRRRLMVRLVKGAYWDTEIKRAQERGLDGYPVFTRKLTTDVSFLACARRLFADAAAFFPQFATHNAHTLAAVLELAGGRKDFEFQRLHGMGEALYERVVDADGRGLPCRVYAPVGSHEDLLAYLVRRLLENGANTSFVNRLADERAPVEDIIADPWEALEALDQVPHPRIPLPRDLYGAERRNSAGVDLGDPGSLRRLAGAMAGPWRPWRAAPGDGTEHDVLDPADHGRLVGVASWAGPAAIERSVAAAVAAAPDWDAVPATARAEMLERAADGIEAARPELMALAVREAGKTINDAVAEVREAADFCRYYAARARADFALPETPPGPTGERNEVSLRGRGAFVCISPWNFPLAIFSGQVAAALAAGNAVIAKPAEQTPLMAARATEIFLDAGIPPGALHLVPGDGAVGARLVADPRTAGIAFTGSVETARAINRTLAARPGPIVPLIAETGGLNVMIVDSTALPEQVVMDAVTSAFRSAGQRCSALRVLFVQDDVADRVLAMLAGAVVELAVGDPGLLETDVGPVIDADAQAALTAHAARLEREGRLICRAPLPEACAAGTFVAPSVFEIDALDRLEGEVFGPILHVVRFAADRLDAVIDAVNATGYGLTFGIHSRIDSRIRDVASRLRVGNVYVNRNMIGAVVGVQPFGGEGLSGTGPKAGGPRYLHRFAVERTLSIDTTAAGGNAQLLSLGGAAAP